VIKCTTFYPVSFRFGIFIVRYLSGYFFPDTVYKQNELETAVVVVIVVDEAMHKVV